jgi:uncharacterized protein YbcI
VTERLYGGQLLAAISDTTVRALSRATGRGPTKARTTMSDNAIFVILEDTLTRGEQTLVDHEEDAAVLDLRRKWQRTMRTELVASIEELTGRRVTGFMSDNHIDPDLGVEVFILERLTSDAEDAPNPPVPNPPATGGGERSRG